MRTAIGLLIIQASLLSLFVVSAYGGSGNATVSLAALFVVTRYIGKRYKKAPATRDRLAELSMQWPEMARAYSKILRFL